MSDTDMLYMASLQKRLADIEAENAELKARAAELESKHWDECRQIAHYDDELKEAKRLLKAAVEGYHFIGHITSDYACPSCTSCSACPMDEGKQCKIWKHADEALALIGEDGEANG